MRRECQERSPSHQLQIRKSLVSDPGYTSRHVCHARAVMMHVGIANPWWWGNVPGIPGACATRNFMYLVRRASLCITESLWQHYSHYSATDHRFIRNHRYVVTSDNCWNEFHSIKLEYWNTNQHTLSFIQENTFEKVLAKISAISVMPYCNNW